MKSKEQRYLELYEQVRTLVEVSETETRLAKLFPQTQLQVGKSVKDVEKLKKKNLGKKGKYHAVIKMKKSSVVGKSDPEPSEQIDQQPESPINNSMMSPEESIRAMQDPLNMAKELLSQGMSIEDVVQYMTSQGIPEQDIEQLVQQLQQQ